MDSRIESCHGWHCSDFDGYEVQIRKTSEAPDVRERLTRNGLILLPYRTPEDFGAFIAKDSRRWEGVARQANIRIDGR